MNRCGTIFTYSIVHSGTDAFKDKTPYVVALVAENQGISLARVEGYTEGKLINVGMEVEFFAEDENGNPIYKFI